jgi:hypothetical protein
MPTKGEAMSFDSNINSFLALTLVGSLALGVALIVWHASTGSNPIADFIAQSEMTQEQLH